MAKTGYLVIVYQDINPSSPTYNQTREERTQDETVCPYRADAKWIEDTKYCELSNGMYTGYEITVYRDVEPLSSTYNQTREEKVLNTTDCEVDETTAEWQNIGDPYCRQTVYMPGGLMDNDGYIVQQQQDVNEYSETYGEIRENATLDTENCPLPNTEPVWQIISESCHVVTHDGQLVYDGTKDVVRVNTNRYSSTWNNNIPETANVEDEENCPPFIEAQYRWVAIDGQYECVGYDKHSVEKQQVSYDGGTTWEDTEEPTRTGSVIESDSSDCGYVPPTPEPGDYSKQYLTFEAVETGTVTIKASNTNAAKTISYSTDGGTTWTDLTTSTTEKTLGGTLSVGDKVLVKGTNGSYGTSNNYRNAFGGSAKTKVYGNIMSLIYGDDFIDKNTLSESYTLLGLFYNNTNLLSAENLVLPATTLSARCYSSMFWGCTNLTTAPALPATTLANYCYDYMFGKCTNLIVAPVLPATTLASNCYEFMFQNCTNLTTAPALPATTLASYCYSNMFSGCTSLTTAPELSATRLVNGCYYFMFQNCTSLVAAPVLPAKSLVVSCYGYMFQGCTSLNYIKAMFTTTPSTSYTGNWVSGVSSTGTFVKNSAATWSVTGVNGIPSGWTVVTE